MIETGGVFHMPKQEVGEGQKHGYIGEDTGEVKTYEPKEPGSSNAVPSVDVAAAKVAYAQRELDKAQRELGEAKVAASKKAEAEAGNPKPVVGGAVVGGKTETVTPPKPPTP